MQKRRTIVKASVETQKMIRKKEYAMAARFEIKTAKNGEFVFDLYATNGQAIATGGETYSSVDAAKTGAESVRKNCAVHVEDQTQAGCVELKHPKYELYKDKTGQFRFRLKASNGEIIAVSEGYKAKTSAKNGIASIGRNAPEAPVVVAE